ncbi:sugar phosphotransferase [Pelomyxa schiedti]|nr:sugar phosphotransferase [Pelomyxa schiedti]
MWHSLRTTTGTDAQQTHNDQPREHQLVNFDGGVVRPRNDSYTSSTEKPSAHHNDLIVPSVVNEAGYCDPVDVVYTWVNGSDPGFLRILANYTKINNNTLRRLRDYGVLRFSVRSVEKFMPHFRNIIIVTNGQVPTWANTSSPRLRIVTHSQIFKTPSNLPTFNSNAIEANLHNIPGIAPCFVYLNDDMFFGRAIPKDHFFNPVEKHLKVYMESAMAPNPERAKKNSWFRSVGHSNDLINAYYNPEATTVIKHHFAGHYCYFINTEISETIYQRWKREFDVTSSHRFRNGNDTAFPFLHANVALEEFHATIAKGYNSGGSWTSDHSNNVAVWKTIASRPYCACLQDGLGDDPASKKEIDFLEEKFCELFPTPSSFELKTQTNPCSHV